MVVLNVLAGGSWLELINERRLRMALAATFILGLAMGFIGAIGLGATIASKQKKEKPAQAPPKKEINTDMIVKLFGEYLKNQENKDGEKK